MPVPSRISGVSLVASLTINRYAGLSTLAGFAKMGSDRAALRGVPGLRFVRLLGTGRGADLTLGADLTRWARFAVWESEAALELFEDSSWRRHELSRASESYTAVLRPLRWHGRWGGEEPFGQASFDAAPAYTGPLAVLTRATIKPRYLRTFWAAVPAPQRGLGDNPDLLASIGVGEAPLLMQATFSLWRSAAAVRAYAYKGSGHRAAIDQTRELGWYGEELFARFAPIASWGSWDGRDPLT